MIGAGAGSGALVMAAPIFPDCARHAQATQRSGNNQGELGRRDVRFLQSWLLSCATAATATRS
jgi:hypothetical protein